MGGDSVKPPETGHVVKEWKQGNARIKVCDDYYRNKTPEEKKMDWDEFYRVAWQIVLNARARGEDV